MKRITLITALLIGMAVNAYALDAGLRGISFTVPYDTDMIVDHFELYQEVNNQLVFIPSHITESSTQYLYGIIPDQPVTMYGGAATLYINTVFIDGEESMRRIDYDVHKPVSVKKVYIMDDFTYQTSVPEEEPILNVEIKKRRRGGNRLTK